MTNNKQQREGFGPLQGLKVLDAGTMIAGPLAATQLADFGADVIKIEQPGVGDPMRDWTPTKDGKSLWWKVLGRNKKLITLALNKQEGQELFKRMVADSDIVIENYRPGTFERWGLGYDVLSEINPGLVLVRVSGYGQYGPYSHRGGYGTVAEAFTGAPSFTGFPDQPPTLPGFPLADSVAATMAAMTAMFAIYRRDQGGTGHGQVIDVSLFEPLFRLIESQVIGYDQLGIVKERQGNRLAEDSPRNTYRTSDGRWIAVSASSQPTFERLADATGMPELITDPRFDGNNNRCQHADILDEMIADWFGKHPFAEIMKLFDERDVVAGPVVDISDIVADPHYAAREAIVDVPDVDFGSVRMQGVTPKMSETPGRVSHSGGNLGTDNMAVFCGEMGLSADEFRRLQNLKVI